MRSRRKPGAQPGNTNALKHGEYSKRLARPAQQSDPLSLDEEIAMLRFAMQRVFSSAERSEDQDLETWGDTLNLLSRSAARLAQVLRTKHQLQSERKDDLTTALQLALNEVSREMGIH